jgi:hypothetical protein
LPVNTTETDKRRLINIIKSRLKGTAYEVAELYEQTWEEIRLALKKTFTTLLDLQSLLIRLSFFEKENMKKYQNLLIA